jgi:hypothetical protein
LSEEGISVGLFAKYYWMGELERLEQLVQDLLNNALLKESIPRRLCIGGFVFTIGFDTITLAIGFGTGALAAG